MYHKPIIKRTALLFLFMIFFVCVYSQSNWGRMSDIDEEESLSIADVGFGLVAGGIMILIGIMLKQIKALSGLGQILFIIGLIMAVGGVVIFLLQVIGMILAAAFSFAFKIAIILGGIFLVIVIVKSIYQSITGQK